MANGDVESEPAGNIADRQAQVAGAIGGEPLVPNSPIGPQNFNLDLDALNQPVPLGLEGMVEGFDTEDPNRVLRQRGTDIPVDAFMFYEQDVLDLLRGLNGQQMWDLQRQLVGQGLLDPEEALTERGHWTLGGPTMVGLVRMMEWANQQIREVSPFEVQQRQRVPNPDWPHPMDVVDKKWTPVFNPNTMDPVPPEPRIGRSLGHGVKLAALQEAMNMRYDMVRSNREQLLKLAEAPGPEDITPIPNKRQMVETAKELFSRRLGRAPRPDELQDIAKVLSAAYEKQWHAELAEQTRLFQEDQERIMGGPEALLMQTDDVPGPWDEADEPVAAGAQWLTPPDRVTPTVAPQAPEDRLDQYIANIRAGELRFNDYVAANESRRGTMLGLLTRSMRP